MIRIDDLSDAECLRFLEDRRLGRLAVVDREGRPFVVPIAYVAEGRTLHLFTVPGRKLEAMRAEPAVCLLVDEIEGTDRWTSVIAEGRFRAMDEAGETAEARHTFQLLSEHAGWWQPGAYRPSDPSADDQRERRPVFFRIEALQVSGRRSHPV